MSPLSALLLLLDNYHNVSEFGTGRAKDQTWWKPKLNDSHRLNIPLSHLPFPNRQDQVGPSLLDAPQSKRLRRSDRVRAEGTNGRYQPDKFGAIVEKFTDPALLNPIETNAEGFQQYFAALPKPTSDADLLSESKVTNKIHKYMQSTYGVHTHIHKYMPHTYIHAYIHTYTYTYRHAYMHTYIRTYYICMHTYTRIYRRCKPFSTCSA